jgi:hypothetical protein
MRFIDYFLMHSEIPGLLQIESHLFSTLCCSYAASLTAVTLLLLVLMLWDETVSLELGLLRADHQSPN